MKKIQVLLKPQCNAEIQNQFATKFGDQCEFTFQGKETEDAIAAAEVVIGEPEEEEILKAENLRWIQLTWAGADKYTKMKAFPTGVTLTNASGAFGKIISEYVIGNIIALYRELPEEQTETPLGTESIIRNHIWKKHSHPGNRGYRKKYCP